MEQGSSSAIQLVYSYAHEDTSLCKQLDKHLSLLKHDRLIITWHDRGISAGAEWEREIDQHLDSSAISVSLLILEEEEDFYE